MKSKAVEEGLDGVTHRVVVSQMANTLAVLNLYFTTHDSITKDEFMDMQLKCWNELKQKLKGGE